MRALVWSLRILVFLLLFAFAVRNTEPATIRLFFGGSVQWPLIVALLVAFGAGVFAGVLAMAGPLFRERRQVSSLRKSRGAEHPPHAIRPPADA